MNLDLPASAGDTLAEVDRGVRRKRAADARLLVLAAHWADLHPEELLGSRPVPGAERAVELGGEGTPRVCEFAPVELGLSLQLHALSARNLIADALDLRHRLSALWALTVDDLALPDWVARKIAATTRRLTWSQVREVDERLADVAATLPPSRLLRLVEAMVLAADEQAEEAREAALRARFVTVNQSTELGTKGVYARLDVADAVRLDAEIDRLARVLASRGDGSTLDVRRSRALGLLARPAAALRLVAEAEPDALDPDLAEALRGLDPAHLRPRAQLVIHLTESDFTRDGHGVARFEGGGPITLAHARTILGHSFVTVRPVIDLAHQLPSDAYEFTGSLRESVLLRTPADCFPYGVSTSRRMQLDHTQPFDPHGPPGQTRAGNGAPMTQRHHRIATHGRWRRSQPRPGLVVSCSPHGRHRMTDHRGTHTISARAGEAVLEGSRVARRLALLLLTTPRCDEAQPSGRVALEFTAA